MEEEYNLDDLFKFQDWASQQSTQLPHTAPGCGIGASPFPESIAASATPNETPRALSQQHCSYQAKLTFVQEAEWDPDQTYDSKPLSCLRYSIEWKVTLNGKAISKDIEPDVVLAPSYYWQLIL